MIFLLGIQSVGFVDSLRFDTDVFFDCGIVLNNRESNSLFFAKLFQQRRAVISAGKQFRPLFVVITTPQPVVNLLPCFGDLFDGCVGFVNEAADIF